METITQVEMKKCTKCLVEKLNTVEFFYLKKGSLISRCKPCKNKVTSSNPNHKIRSHTYYYKNQELCQKKRMIKYIEETKGVCLVG